MAEVRPSEQLGTRLGPSIIVLSRIGRENLRGATAMKLLVRCCVLLSTIAISIAASLPAPAAPRARVFVSTASDDANPCTAGSPCKTFQHAHDVVAAGGEISVLDTGGYGPLTITKALSIVNPTGVEASIAVSSGNNAITITATASDKISLRGLTLDGTGVGQDGIEFTSGGVLEITDCVVRGFSEGLFFVPSASAVLKVTNSEFNDNSDRGIFISPQSSGINVRGVLDHVGLYNNLGCLDVDGNIAMGGTLAVTVKDSTVSNCGLPNNGVGVAIETDASGAPSHVMLVRTTIANNPNFGILASGAGAHVVVDSSTIFNNDHAWAVFNSGQIFSYGNNSVFDNTDDFGAQTAATQK